MVSFVSAFPQLVWECNGEGVIKIAD